MKRWLHYKYPSWAAKQVFLSCEEKWGDVVMPCPRPTAVNDGCFNREGKGQWWTGWQKKIKVVLVKKHKFCSSSFHSLWLTHSQWNMRTFPSTFSSLLLTFTLFNTSLSHSRTKLTSTSILIETRKNKKLQRINRMKIKRRSSRCSPTCFFDSSIGFNYWKQA